MPYKKIEIHKFNLDNRRKLFEEKAPNKVEYELVMKHLKELSNGEVTGKIVSEKRQRKLLDMFVIFFNYYKKPSSTLTLDILKKFKEDLLNDRIKKINGDNYADTTKEDLIETIRRYLECEYPNKIPGWNLKSMAFRKWFRIRPKKKTPEILEESEIEELIEKSKTIEGKFLIAVLFDSGCRIEEFLNLRYEDIEYPTENFPYFKFDLKEEYSKTKGRKIGLYWKPSTPIINRYLSSCEKKDNTEQIFPKEYGAVRMFLSRLGKKVLNKRVHPHLIRKSSATYYADKLNRQELSLRYGWSFSSSMPDVYISRAGLDEEKIKERIINTDLSKIQKENEELKMSMDKFKKMVKEDMKLLIQDARDLRKTLSPEILEMKINVKGG